MGNKKNEQSSDYIIQTGKPNKYERRAGAIYQKKNPHTGTPLVDQNGQPLLLHDNTNYPLRTFGAAGLGVLGGGAAAWGLKSIIDEPAIKAAEASFQMPGLVRTRDKAVKSVEAASRNSAEAAKSWLGNMDAYNDAKNIEDEAKTALKDAETAVSKQQNKITKYSKQAHRNQEASHKVLNAGKNMIKRGVNVIGRTIKHRLKKDGGILYRIK